MCDGHVEVWDCRALVFRSPQFQPSGVNLLRYCLKLFGTDEWVPEIVNILGLELGSGLVELSIIR